MRVYAREAWRSLAANKQRSGLALLGILIGIASVIALVSLGNIFSAEATRKFRELGTNIARVGFASNDERNTSLRSSRFGQGMANSVACVEAAVPFAQTSSLRAGPGGSVQTSVLAATAGLARLARLQLVEGRFLSDLDAGSRFVVLGAKAARDYRPTRSGSLIGQEIVLLERSYTVVGVLAPNSALNVLNIEIDEAHLVQADGWAREATGNLLNSVLVRMRNDIDYAACAGDLVLYTKRRDPSLQVAVRTADQLIATMRDQTALIRVLLTAIGSISLVVGGVGIMNIMLVSVSERRQEIGVRRALGAKQADIRYQFLSEALMLAALGGCIGALIGAATTLVVAHLNNWEFFLLPGPFLLGVGVSVLIGMLFGYWPAHQASLQDPIAALRSD